MNQFKKAQVIMLPTKQFNEARLGYYKDVLNLNNSKYDKSLEVFRSINGITVPNPQHLYIISDDKIEDNDWCYCKKANKLFQVKSSYKIDENTIGYIFINGGVSNNNDCKKIIATTDTSLTIDCKINKNKLYYLPQPSQQFIEQYIESYNKGEDIADVLVEYEEKSNEDIQRELGIFGHDEGLLESEYNEYIKTNSIDKLRVNPRSIKINSIDKIN